MSDIFNVINEDYNTILDRKANPINGSYTTYLLTKGLDKTLKKVGEEATEVIIACKNESKEEIVGEIGDLLYHLSVAMVQKDVTWEDVAKLMVERQNKEHEKDYTL